MPAQLTVLVETFQIERMSVREKYPVEGYTPKYVRKENPMYPNGFVYGGKNDKSGEILTFPVEHLRESVVKGG
jgi:hypothetical protein